MVCASDQAVIIDKEIYDEFVAEFKFITLTCKQKKSSSWRVLLRRESKQQNCAGAKLNADIVGKPATLTAEQLDLLFQKEQTFLLQNVKKLVKRAIDLKNCRPVIAVLKSENREDGINKARQMVEFNGLGH